MGHNFVTFNLTLTVNFQNQGLRHNHNVSVVVDSTEEHHMEKSERKKGIAGLTNLFKDSVEDIPNGSKVAFTGSIGSCPPIAEMLAFAVRKREFELSYVPLANSLEARLMKWTEGLGFTMSAEKAQLQQADVLVVLGGLAMPKIGCPIEDVEALIDELGDIRLIGIGFMDILNRNGWTDKLSFDTLIDGYMDAGILSKN